MDHNSKASRLLSEHLAKQQSKDPALAAKQRRLLEKLSADTSSPQPADSSSSTPIAGTPSPLLPNASPKKP